MTGVSKRGQYRENFKREEYIVHTMGKEITGSHFDQRDFHRFERLLQQETALLASWFDQGMLASSPPVVGLELEAWLLDTALLPAPCNQHFLTALDRALVVPELASFNVEINNHPQPLTGTPFSRLHDELEQTWEHASRVARSIDRRLAMIGTLPTIEEQHLSLDNISNLQRYRALNEQVMRMRQGYPLQFCIEGNETLLLEHRDVMMEAAATSLQIHLQVPFEQSVDALNNAIRLSAPMVALCANAPYLLGMDLWDDSRIPLFEQAVNVDPLCHRLGEGRVSFGTGYAEQSLFELFQENLDHYPIMLPIVQDDTIEQLNHLLLHNGTIWRWNRPLVGFDQQHNPHLRIEHRVASAGPTPLDVIANTLFFTGALMGMLNQPDRAAHQLPFDTARNNFYHAARYGLDSAIIWGERTVFLRELLLLELVPLAASGLEQMEIDPADWKPWLELIEERVHSGRNGACWQRQWVSHHGADFTGLTEAYLQWQESGNPVHEWGMQ